MDSVKIKNDIKSAIEGFSKGNLTENALSLFNTLGYVTDRQAPLSRKTKEEFRETFISKQSRFDEAKAKFSQWKYVDLLFQLSKEEVLKQTSLFDTKRVDNSAIEAYLFFVIQLEHDHYSRTELSQITREVNRLFPMPAMILFKHGSTLTLSIINRRLHKRDESKDVLEKVTQIKDISISNPHRAHIEILFDLSFDELKDKYEFKNFVELHNAWQKTLDTKELNKRFFKELANWYFWACSRVAFPDDEIKDREVRNATSVIRLITRLIFVWFLKEKNLVTEDLFEKKKIEQLLKFSDKNNSTYYKAILQNLFFATLNTEMGKRKFRSAAEKSRSSHFLIHNVFRYEKEFVKPKETLEKCFDPIPFLNGGLFECLDKQEEVNGKLKAIRIDGFSDRNDNVLKVPDDLFFCEKEIIIDLSKIYGTPRKSKEKVRGLIDILGSYKFTITENTPIEEEVALDPELLGKVFENLLANFNPETQTTARKQTGSFYTPREIVNYMVDESLLAYLKQNLNDQTETEHNLRELLSYSDTEVKFSKSEKEKLINAIDNIKIIDPACGSGAFPMGILQKLVHTLYKLDPKNELWKQRQIEKASSIDDLPSREAAIETIEEAFENNELDYGRKLYLIENCIYGVDIQPIAVQIAKLRFFISLIVEQKTNPKKDNLGIRPLPNLETKFVAANTLVELEKENANLFTNPEIEKKKEQLKRVRHDYFEARTPKRKENCRDKDKQLRDELAELLVTNHDLQPETAKRLVAWNPYDQNISADFFDTDWMFGLKEGFDIVIGNPPYIEFKKLPAKEKLKLTKYKSARGKYDIYVIFDERASELLDASGILCFIQPTTFMKKDFGESIREVIKSKYRIISILDFGDIQVFEGATNYTGVFIFCKSKSKVQYSFSYHQYSNTGKNVSVIDFQRSLVENSSSSIKNYLEVESAELSSCQWNFQSISTKKLLQKLYNETKPLSEITESIFQGIASGKDEVFYVSDEIVKEYKLEKSILRKLLKGKDIKKYSVDWSGFYVVYPYDMNSKVLSEAELKRNYPKTYNYLLMCRDVLKGRDYLDNSAKKWFELWNQRSAESFNRNRIVCPEIADRNKFMATNSFYGNTKTYHIIPLESSCENFNFLLGLLNSNLLDFIYKKIATPQAGGFYAYKTQFLSKVPIKTTSNKRPFSNIVNCILLLKMQSKDSYFFESLMDAMVYELYLPESIKAAGAEVLKHLNDLPELKKGDGEKNLKIIEKVYKELSDPKHPVSVAMSKMKSVEEVTIIEGKK